MKTNKKTTKNKNVQKSESGLSAEVMPIGYMSFDRLRSSDIMSLLALLLRTKSSTEENK